jgi:hypothetical protein
LLVKLLDAGQRLPCPTLGRGSIPRTPRHSSEDGVQIERIFCAPDRLGVQLVSRL